MALQPFAVARQVAPQYKYYDNIMIMYPANITLWRVRRAADAPPPLALPLSCWSDVFHDAEGNLHVRAGLVVSAEEACIGEQAYAPNSREPSLSVYPVVRTSCTAE